MRAVFASHNAHKAEQVAVLLPDVELVPLDDLVPGLELPEPFDTFLENALNKARIAAAATGLPAIADDSGIEVDALDGAPGVFSARFAGPGATDAENNLKLVDALQGVPDDLRTCRYRCVAVLVTPEGDELVADGACEGRVVDEPRGSLGFGYDPHVVPEGESRTMGEIPLEEKLEFSHRGRAFRALVGKIELLAASRRSGELRVRRGIDSITTSSVDADPFVQFAHWLDEALANETGEPNAMTLATSSSSGDVSAHRPAQRLRPRGVRVLHESQLSEGQASDGEPESRSRVPLGCSSAAGDDHRHGCTSAGRGVRSLLRITSPWPPDRCVGFGSERTDRRSSGA